MRLKSGERNNCEGSEEEVGHFLVEIKKRKNIKFASTYCPLSPVLFWLGHFELGHLTYETHLATAYIEGENINDNLMLPRVIMNATTAVGNQ